MRSKGSRFRGFEIYIHEKGQFWLSTLPNVKKYIVHPKKVVQFSFKILKENAVEGKQFCTYEADFRYTKCIEDFVSTMVGCSLHWFRNSTGKKCRVTEDISETQSHYQKIRHNSYEKISTNLTKCYQKCDQTVYEIEKLSEEDIVWKTDWISEVKLSMK